LILSLPVDGEELPPPVHTLNLAPERDYGIVIGEVVSSEIAVAVDPGYVLENAGVPQPGSAVSDELELRAIQLSQQSVVGETRYRIKLDYQVFKGVRSPEVLTVPPLPLRFSRDRQAVEIQAPAWHFSLNPIIPPQLPDGEVVIRGDLAAPAYANGGHGRWVALCVAGLAGLGIYAAWRQGGLRRRVPPFTRAARALKKLGRQPATPETWRQGAKLVHAALNESAGWTVLSGQLPRLFTDHPAYAAWQAELERFFAVSDRLFFAEAVDYPADCPLSWLEGLCRKLARAVP
jgi:mxaA protein